MSRRNRKVDVFGGILEASDGEIEAAGVRRNHDDDGNELVQNSSKKGKKRVRFPATVDSDSPGAENGTTPGPSRKSNGKGFRFPKDGTYVNESKEPLMHELAVHENSLGLPLRTLDDFFLFESGAAMRTLVPITALSEGTGACEAYGMVHSHLKSEAENDDYEQVKIPFRTTVILRLLPEVFRQEIMIQTEFAIYILGTPAHFYQEYYLPFYKKEMIMRLVVKQIYDDPDAKEAEFFENIEDDEDPILKKAWTAEDIVPEMKYTREELQDILSVTPSVSWEDVPLLKIILTDPGNLPRRALPRSVARAPEVFPQKKKRTKVPPCWETTVTPIIDRLIVGHLETAIKVVGKWPPHLKKHLFFRERPPIPPSVNNYIPVPGDFVLVKKTIDDGGDTSDSDSESESESDSEDGGDTDKKPLIAQVIRVHSRRSFHVRWFVHGADTILEEFAHGQELFLSLADGCGDITVDLVLAKCKVVRISLRENSRQAWPDKNSYFYCATWDRKDPVGFVEVTDKQVEINECHECIKNAEPLSERTPDGARVKNVEYHLRDFIRYRVNNGIVCGFGQINRILTSPHDDEITIEIFQIGRVKDRSDPDHFNDMELFMTSSTKFIQAADILGRVRILHTAQYERQCVNDPKWIFNNQFIFHMQSKASNLDAHFSSLTEEEFQTCDTCLEEASAQDFSQSLCRGERILRALDPYIGAAGFGAGLSEGCSMKTVFGVDKNPSATETARKNLSRDAEILTNDASRILAKIVDGTINPGEIDLIYSGPPCQNDSNLNRHKTDPIRPLFTTLSYVDALRPDFFVLESVLGFLSRKLVKKKVGKEEKEIEEKKAGELKLALRILHFLGYNVSGGIMYALSYGVPQTRSRFFLVASSPSYGAFSFPEPTHGFKTSKGRKDPVGRLLPRPSKRHKLNDTLKLPINLGLGTGLLETVTVAETLSDLPLFDWMVPKSGLPVRPQVQQVPVGPRKAIWGIRDSKFMYTRPCVNSYQYRLRFDIGTKLRPLYQHYTKHFVSDKVLNILDLPIVDGADYRHLQQQNLEWGLRDPASSKAIQGHRGHAYTRLIPSGYFDTIVTNVGPNAKQAKIIHPHCKRILSVREYARAQGFPDSFAFYSEDNKPDDYLKQIGNSVPFAVSAAIGRAIQELVFQKWLKDNDT